MGFVNNMFRTFSKGTGIGGYAKHNGVETPPPAAPGIDTAANAAQLQRDQMRQRRGLLANIYAGGTNQQPVTGSQQLGT